MASFQEHVKLITEANQTLAAIAKVNAAIMKLRENASKPINVKINYEQQKIIQGEQKIRAERQKTADAETRTLNKRLEDYKKIKRMNEEQGGPAHIVRFGSPKSLEQGRQFNDQLSVTTKYINQLGDAYKHLNLVSKAAGVKLSPGMSDKLANQTVNKTNKAEADAIKEAIRLEKELNDNKMKSIALSAKLKEANANIEASAGARAQIQLQRELERIARESGRAQIEVEREVRRVGLESIKSLIAADKERIRLEKERSKIASANERGARGWGGELIRDSRKYLIYGGLNQGERGMAAGYEAAVDRSTVRENLKQAGRTTEEIDNITDRAVGLVDKYKNLTVTELMTMQQHNRGATGNRANAEALNDITASYISLRKDKVGEGAALSENLANLKIGEETGHINDPVWMKRLYDTQARVAQTEGGQYDPKSFLTTVRMEKTAKFNLSDEAQFNIMPFLGIAEGAGRAGNEVAMLFKSLTYAGKSISKQNHAAISGTIFSDAKGGYNPEISQRLAAGDLPGLLAIVDKFLRQKGLNPEDKSTSNKTSEMNALAKTISNTSAREALITLTENLPQFQKQQRALEIAQGLAAAKDLTTRTLKSAQDAMKAGFDNLSVASLGPFNQWLINRMNNIADAENWAAKNPGRAGLGLAAAGVGALGVYAASNPAQVAHEGALWANTWALNRNTGSRALTGLPGEKGSGKGTGLGLIATGIKLGVGIGAIVMAGQALEGYLGEDANSWEGIGRRGRKDFRIWTGIDADPDNQLQSKANRGVPSFASPSNSGFYGPMLPSNIGVGEKPSPFGTIGSPQFGSVNVDNHLGAVGAEFQRVVSEGLTNSKIDSALKSVGDSITDGASKVGSSIAGGGGAIVGAIEDIASRIRSISIPTFVGGNFHDLSVPVTGLHRRGPQ